MIMEEALSFVEVLLKRYSNSQLDKDCNFAVFGELAIQSEPTPERPLTLPPALSLNRCQVKHAGPEEQIRELCHSVEQLDLAANHLRDLEEVYKILRSMPSLRFVNLSENDLSECHFELDCHPPEHYRHATIRHLVLNNTRIPWSAVQLLLRSMPQVEELHLSLNNYSRIELNPDEHSHSNIESLYLSGNPELTNWSEVAKLMQSFPSLESLTMADCSICSIPEEVVPLLSNLVSFNISNWPIKSWSCVERLNRLPRLSQLRCAGIGVLSELKTGDARRQHLIARLPGITRLNGGEISKEERTIAERSFIRAFSNKENVDQDLPSRFHELCSVHGRLEPLVKVDLKPPRFANVRVFLNDLTAGQLADANYESFVQHCHTLKNVKVDVNKSVRNFKLQLAKLFEVPGASVRLFRIDQEMSQYVGQLLVEELRWGSETRKLHSMSVQDGDEFMVKIKK